VSPPAAQAPRRGEIWWAFVDFAPASPFEVYDDRTGRLERIEATELAREIRAQRRAPQFETVLGMKLRTVLVLQEPRERIPEYIVLKLAALTRLAPTDLARIRRGEELSLLYLPAQRSGLEQEGAVDLNSLARLNASVFPVARPAGKLDSSTMRTLDERLAAYFQLDLSALIKAQATAMVEAIRRMAEQADQERSPG